LSIQSYSQILAQIAVFLPETVPDSVIITGQLYMNNEFISTWPISNNYENWNYSDDPFNNQQEFYSDSIYYAGIEIQYNTGTDFTIAVDTSSYHNFSAESIIRINNEWSTPDFVPLIKLVYNPEEINESDLKEKIKVYPNPASDILYLKNNTYKDVEILDLSGKNIYTISCVDKDHLDISFLPNGYYFLRFINDQEIISTKIEVIK